jgi:hypothetical protein
MFKDQVVRFLGHDNYSTGKKLTIPEERNRRLCNKDGLGYHSAAVAIRRVVVLLVQAKPKGFKKPFVKK